MDWIELYCFIKVVGIFIPLVMIAVLFLLLTCSELFAVANDKINELRKGDDSR